MNPEFRFKFRRIYLLYVVVLFGCILVYSFANWALTMRIPNDFKESMADTVLPYAVGALATLIFLFRRIRLLHVVDYRGRDTFWGILMMAALSIGVSVSVAQKYLRDASCKFERLNSIIEISTENGKKFLSIKEFYVDKAHPVTQMHVSYASKGNTEIRFDYYVLFPVYKSKADTGKTYAWMGLHYDDVRQNPHNENAEHLLENEFIAQSAQQYAKDKFWPFDYFIVPGNTPEQYRSILAAHNEVTDLPILTVPQNSYREVLFEERFWLLVVLGITLATTFIFVFISDLRHDVLLKLNKTIKAQQREKNAAKT